jgi:hypothetical protein
VTDIENSRIFDKIVKKLKNLTTRVAADRSGSVASKPVIESTSCVTSAAPTRMATAVCHARAG